jgi:kynurenine formamidase
VPRRFVDLSHTVADGLVTYPGLPGPEVSDHLSREASRATYAPGTEFQIGRISMVANTGTYLDTPFHRFPGGSDLAAIPLDAVAGLPVVVVDAPPEAAGPAIAPGVLPPGADLAGSAVLFRTGWDRHWATATYGGGGHPHLSVPLVDALVAAGPALVGIDSLNIDDTAAGERPAHTGLLGAGIYVLEHLTGLDQLGPAPVSGWELYAVPVKVEGMGTFPVRAFAATAPG